MASVEQAWMQLSARSSTGRLPKEAMMNAFIRHCNPEDIPLPPERVKLVTGICLAITQFVFCVKLRARVDIDLNTNFIGNIRGNLQPFLQPNDVEPSMDPTFRSFYWDVQDELGDSMLFLIAGISQETLLTIFNSKRSKLQIRQFLRASQDRLESPELKDLVKVEMRQLREAMASKNGMLP